MIFKLDSSKNIANILRLAESRQNDVLVKEPHCCDYAVVHYFERCLRKKVTMISLKDIFFVATVGTAVLSLAHSLLKFSKHYRAIFIVSILYIWSIIREFELGASKKPCV